MSPSFYSISTFRSAIELLSKKESDQYHLCKQDICDFFSNLDFNAIWELNYRLIDHGDIRAIKIRLPNSAQKIGKSEGYRLIICCNRKHQSVILLNIYPKKGKYGKENQEKEEYKHQMKEYGKEFKEGKLLCHNIKEELATIKPSTQSIPSQ